MTPRDYFSEQSKIYATFRPTYPEELYSFIFSQLKQRDIAWDCATGNGQVARRLAGEFKSVYATDISRQQLEHATPAPNIYYSVTPAEQTTFEDDFFDLITVGQALHWFDADKFYNEARRTSKRHALLAAWGYALLSVSPQIDKLFLEFYYEKVGTYWDYARKLVENEYAAVAFPFPEIRAPKFSIVVNWTCEELAGYVSSWSATRKYIAENGHDPVPELTTRLKPLWSGSKKVTFPLFLRLGRLHG